MQRKTILNEVSYSGIALHSGKAVQIVLQPHNNGIVFKYKETLIPALYSNVTNTKLCTVISKDGINISTIEHLMAALWGNGITDVLIEIDGFEVPVGDGSAVIFHNLINEAGIQNLNSTIDDFVVTTPISFKTDNFSINVLPSDEFVIDFRINFPDEAIGVQEYTFGETDNFENILRARTFGRIEEVELLKQMGLARGGSLENAVVINNGVVINKEGLRYSNEFVRHKILDALGDFHLAGRKIKGRFVCKCSGHMANNQILREILDYKTITQAA